MPTASDDRRLHLTTAQRAVLEALIRDKPQLSGGRIAVLFRAKTGRKISTVTVQDRRKAGGYVAQPANGHLSDEHREVLTLLLSEAGPEDGHREVADQFAAMTGRAIDKHSVWLHAVEVLGMAKAGPRRGPRQATTAIESRMEAATARKLARSKVDRSPRVGRRSGARIG